MSTTPAITVQGVTVPAMLYGTAWKEDDTARCVRDALAAGFRGFDTAAQRKHYHEAGVGEGIAAFLAEHGRDALFVQTKFTYARGQDHRLPYDPAAPCPVQVRQSFARSLHNLGVAHLDALVLHGPEHADGLSETDRAVWREFEALHAEGQVRLLGVSSVSADQLRRLLDFARIPPAFVQNRCYARLGWGAAERAVADEAGVVYQGFSLLTANRGVWNHADVAAIARRLGATPAQVILRFARAVGMQPLTGTTDPRHMAQDLAALDLALCQDDISAILRLGR